MSFEIRSTLEWNGSAAMRDFDIANGRALLEAAILVEGKAVENTTGHRITGKLSQSITRVIDKISAFVGTNVEYAPYEEFGTRFRDPHPFLKPAFNSSVRQIKVIFDKWYRSVRYVQ